MNFNYCYWNNTGAWSGWSGGELECWCSWRCHYHHLRTLNSQTNIPHRVHWCWLRTWTQPNQWSRIIHQMRCVVAVFGWGESRRPVLLYCASWRRHFSPHTTLQTTYTYSYSPSVCLMPILVVKTLIKMITFHSQKLQENCAIAKMTARCALYKWIEWVVAGIWPFEIIQDGGLPPTWIWCNRK